MSWRVRLESFVSINPNHIFHVVGLECGFTLNLSPTAGVAAAKGERPPSAPPALPRASREEMESAAAAYQEPSPPPSPRLSGGGAAGVADLPSHPGPPISPATNRHRYIVLCDSC